MIKSVRLSEAPGKRTAHPVMPQNGYHSISILWISQKELRLHLNSKDTPQGLDTGDVVGTGVTFVTFAMSSRTPPFHLLTPHTTNCQRKTLGTPFEPLFLPHPLHPVSSSWCLPEGAGHCPWWSNIGKGKRVAL